MADPRQQLEQILNILENLRRRAPSVAGALDTFQKSLVAALSTGNIQQLNAVINTFNNLQTAFRGAPAQVRGFTLAFKDLSEVLREVAVNNEFLARSIGTNLGRLRALAGTLTTGVAPAARGLIPPTPAIVPSPAATGVQREVLTPAQEKAIDRDQVLLIKDYIAERRRQIQVEKELKTEQTKKEKLIDRQQADEIREYIRARREQIQAEKELKATQARKEKLIDIEQADAIRDHIKLRKEQIQLEAQQARQRERAAKQAQADLDKQFAREVELAQARAAQQRLVDPRLGGGISQLFGGDLRRAAEFERQLQRMGFGLNNITRISTEATTGISSITASIQDNSGVTREATVHIDRFGRALTDHSNRFRSLSDIISNNIYKVLSWSIAIGVVYGSFQKLGEIVGQIRTIETAMSQIGIATQKTGADLQKFFDIASDVARVVGADTIDALNQFDYALRAVGTAGGEQQRIKIATQLLTDSLILAKLAAIDQATAMDTLAAALRQIGLPLDQGIKLLDKWQAVANAVGANMNDMARTFANTADAATDLGIEFDELNAFIGALSGGTTLSSQEINNALRAMFVNFTTDKAIGELQKYGISVKNLATDQFRSFTEVYDEIVDKIASGELGSRAQAEIAAALGGGSRRGAQVATLFGQEALYRRGLEASRRASGEAGIALKEILNDLDTAIKQLGNAFTTFAQTLGGTGGLLTVMKQAVSVVTGLFDIITKITDALGPATTAVLAFIAAWSVSRNLRLAERLGGGGFGGFLSGTISGGVLGRGKLGTPQIAEAGAYTAEGFQRILIPTAGTMAQVFASGLKASLPAVFMAAAHAGAGDWGKAGATAFGGALAGILTGNPMWSIIGGTIAGFILDAFRQGAANAQIETKARVEPIPTIRGTETLEELSKLEEDITAKAEALSKSMTGIFSGLTGKAPLDELKAAIEAFDYLNQTPGAVNPFPEETIALARAYLKVLEQIVEARERLAGKPEGITPEKLGISTQLQTQLNAQLAQLRIQARQKAGFGLIEEDITAAKYRQQILAISRVGGTAGEPGQLVYTLQNLGSSLDEIEPKLARMGISIEDLFNAMYQAPPEEIAFVQDLFAAAEGAKDAIGDIQKAIEEYATTGKISISQEDATALGLGNVKEITRQVLDAVLADWQNTYEELLSSSDVALQKLVQMFKAAQEEFKFRGFTDLSEFTTAELETVFNEARALQRIYAEDTGVTFDQIASSVDAWVYMNQRGFAEVTDIEQAFVSESAQRHQERQKAIEEASRFNFKALRDLPADAAAQLQRGINYYTQLLRQYGFNERNELITVLFKDNAVRQLIGSQTALQLALEDLTEVTKKQTEGVYNLPAGAVAYVPITSVFNPPDGGGGGGFPAYPEAPMVELTPIESPLNSLDATAKDIKSLLQRRLEQYMKETGGRTPEQIAQANAQALIKRGLYEEPGVPTVPKTTYPYNLPPKYFESEKLGGKPTLEQGLLGIINSVFSFFNRVKPPGLDLTIPGAGKVGAAPALQPVQVNLNQRPVKNEFVAHVNLVVSGRILANIVKPFLFEDLQRMAASIGSSNRQTNVIVS